MLDGCNEGSLDGCNEGENDAEGVGYDEGNNELGVDEVCVVGEFVALVFVGCNDDGRALGTDDGDRVGHDDWKLLLGSADIEGDDDDGVLVN